jgi:CheY-like chemotaxis protein
MDKKIILILEDEETIRLILEQGLKSTFGEESLEILSTGDGKKALRLIFERDGKIDLIVTDIHHPGISGLELAEMVRQDYPNIKIIFCSGYASATVIDKCNEVADYYLAKPVNFEEYENVVGKYLNIGDLH